jgi:hypothetical protein
VTAEGYSMAEVRIDNVDGSCRRKLRRTKGTGSPATCATCNASRVCMSTSLIHAASGHGETMLPAIFHGGAVSSGGDRKIHRRYFSCGSPATVTGTDRRSWRWISSGSDNSKGNQITLIPPCHHPLIHPLTPSPLGFFGFAAYRRSTPCTSDHGGWKNFHLIRLFSPIGRLGCDI